MLKPTELCHRPRETLFDAPAAMRMQYSKICITATLRTRQHSELALTCDRQVAAIYRFIYLAGPCNGTTKGARYMQGGCYMQVAVTVRTGFTVCRKSAQSFRLALMFGAILCQI